MCQGVGVGKPLFPRLRSTVARHVSKSTLQSDTRNRFAYVFDVAGCVQFGHHWHSDWKGWLGVDLRARPSPLANMFSLVLPCSPLFSPVLPCSPLFSLVPLVLLVLLCSPCSLLFSLVLPCSPLFSPVLPCSPYVLHSFSVFSPVLPCSPLFSPVLPCSPLFSPLLPSSPLFSPIRPCPPTPCSCHRVVLGLPWGPPPPL